MGSVKNKVDKVMNKVADKIMPKELAKVTPYLAMAAPFLGPVGMLATLPAQALADAKNYGKLNYKKLALQAAMTGLAKTGQAGKATAAEKNFMGEMGGDPTLNPDSFRAPTDAMKFATDNSDAFNTFAENFKYEPGLEGIGQRVSDVVTKTGRSMYQPLQFGENAPSISDQLFNMDRAKQAAFMLGPMTTYASMDALDQMEAGQGGGSGGSEGIGAQALYNDFLQSGRLAGYTDDEINTIYGPYGDMAGGDYQTVNVDRGPRRRQFPGTNYNLFTYANGGRVNKALGGAIGMALREAMEAAAKNPNLFKVLNPKEGIGQVIEMMKKLPKVKPRDRRTEGIDIFGKRRPRDIDQYQDEIIRQMEELDSFAAGGRVGYAEGDIVSPEQILDDEELQKKLIRDALFPEGSPGANEDSIADQMYNIQMQEMMNPRMGRANGGITQVAPGVPAGMELDYRNTGGFIPMGGPERADDVPAMLSKNEFVMTADAVRGMGDGDINAGAQRMYDLMNNMEAKV